MSAARWRLAAVVAVLAVCAVCAGVAYAAVVYLPALLRGTGCEASSAQGTIELTLDQAENASTVAAVGIREGMPRQAITVALAAAFQESKLRNVPYGDRDSVGLFQQRPSQGWGRQAQLLDPVYASTRFYDSLSDVEGYRAMPVHEAAQAVQRSADGAAYAQHEVKARILSAALTGQEGAGLRCWFDEAIGFDPTGVRTQLAREFGARADTTAAGDGINVRARGERRGWAVALWAVSNARELGIGSIAYRDMRWTAENGYDGWQPAQTPPRQVLIRGGQ